MAAASPSGSCPGLPAALAFLRSFPEASSYNILILSPDKQALVSRPQASPDMVQHNLSRWLEMPNVHVFVRPNVSKLVMVDADAFEGDIATLLALKPRCLAETSPRHYQLWLTLGNHLSGKASLQVTKDLSRALGADMASAKTTQVGRLPGSVNVKVGKGNRVTLLHSSLEDMDEQVYLRLVPDTALCFDGSAPRVRSLPPRHPAGGLDRSKLDWAMACAFFEENVDATVQEGQAKLAGSFQAQRGNQEYYETLTVRKAFEHVRSQAAYKAAARPALANAPDAVPRAPACSQSQMVAPALPSDHVSKDDVQRMPLGLFMACSWL